MFAITQAQIKIIELRTTPYQDWPEEAKQLARCVLASQAAAGAMLDQLDRKDWLVSKVERLQTQQNTISNWIGE